MFQKKNNRFTILFELVPDEVKANVERLTAEYMDNSTLSQIAQIVCTNSQNLNITDVDKWLLEHPECKRDNPNVKTLLSMPIINGKNDLIGVAQMKNKLPVEVSISYIYFYLIYFFN